MNILSPGDVLKERQWMVEVSGSISSRRHPAIFSDENINGETYSVKAMET